MSYLRFLPLAALLPGLTSAGSLPLDPIDQIRDALSENADGFGTQIQGLAAYGAIPGASGGRLTIDGDGFADDTTLSRLNIPLSKTWDGVGPGNSSLRTGLALGWLRGETDYDSFLPNTPFDATTSSEISAFSAFAGIGLEFPVNDCWTLTPIAMLGYSYIDDDTDFRGPGADNLDDVTDDILFNYTAEELLYGVGLELRYETTFANDIEVLWRSRYNQLWGETLDASDSSLEETGQFGIFTTFLEFNGPTQWDLFGRDLRWIGFSGNTTLFGDAQDSLGFDYYFELGGGIMLVDRSVFKGIEGISLRGSVIAGDNVTGWSAGAKLEF